MRRRRAVKRKIQPEPRYESIDLARFINKVMMRGKKSFARKSVYNALEKLEGVTGEPAIESFYKAIKNATPLLEVRPTRIGGATYQVPIEVRPSRRLALAQRWIIQACRKTKRQTLSERLFRELLDAYNETGVAVRRRDEAHRMAEANRAFSHYRW